MDISLSHAKGRTDAPLVSVHQGRRYSYAALAAEVDRLASALLGLGLRPGERIGIWSHNNVEWVLMQLATARVGLVLVNINPAYRTAERTKNRLNDRLNQRTPCPLSRRNSTPAPPTSRPMPPPCAPWWTT